MSRITPSVSFNLENVYEKGLYDYAKTQDKYFGRYVKRLIDRDRAGGVVVPATVPIVTPEEEPMKFNKTTIKSFL